MGMEHQARVRDAFLRLRRFPHGRDLAAALGATFSSHAEATPTVQLPRRHPLAVRGRESVVVAFCAAMGAALPRTYAWLLGAVAAADAPPSLATDQQMRSDAQLRLVRLCAGVLGLSCALLWAQEKPKSHMLQCAFQVGHSQFFRVTVSAETTSKSAQAHDLNGSTVELTTEERVVGVNDGMADLEVTVRRVVAHMTGREPFDYDSDDPKGDPGVLHEIADIVGKTLKAKMDQRGRVTDWKAPDRVPALSSSKASAPLGPIVEFPDHPVAVGEGWETPYKLPSSVSVESGGKKDSSAEGARLRSTLVAVESGKAIVQREIRAIDKPKEANGLVTQLLSDTGRCTVDLATGQTLEGEQKTVINISGHGMEMTVTTTARRQAIADPGKRPAGK